MIWGVPGRGRREPCVGFAAELQSLRFRDLRDSFPHSKLEGEFAGTGGLVPAVGGDHRQGAPKS